MNLVRFDPWKEMQDIQNAMSRFFHPPQVRGDAESTFRGGRWSPAVDIVETQQEVVFTAELPGFEKDEVDISVNEGHLIISGERKFTEEKESRYHQVERWYGNFYRSFLLPTSVNHEKISAKLKNGLLTVTLPKKEEAKPRQIAVSVS